MTVETKTIGRRSFPDLAFVTVDGVTASGGGVPGDPIKFIGGGGTVESLSITGKVSPPDLGGRTIDNWDPGITDKSIIEITNDDANSTITGIAAQDDGRVLVIHSKSTNSNPFTLVDQSGSASDPANQIDLPGGENWRIYPGTTVIIFYDGTRDIWVPFGMWGQSVASLHSEGLISADGSILINAGGLAINSSGATMNDQAIQCDGYVDCHQIINRGSLIDAGITSPAALTEDVNNYNALNAFNTRVARIDQVAAFSITGIIAPNSAQGGCRITILNISEFDLTLKNDDGNSIETNRFALPGKADVVIGSLDTFEIWYDPNFNRWVKG